MIARFTPQAWVNDYAVDVDPEGPTEWKVSEAFAAEFAGVTDSADLDDLKDDPAAPEWVREFQGPFEIHVTTTYA